MKNKIVILHFLVLFYCQLIASIDPFYLQTLEKGKNLYFDNQLDMALENLRIAEFGLMTEAEYLKEVYVLQALCYFKLNRPQETLEVLDKIRNELRINELSSMKKPEAIQQDWERLLAVMEKKPSIKLKTGSSKTVRKNISLMNSFETIFQNTRELIKNGQFDRADNEIKKLKKMNKKDIRIDYLEARICFEKKKYPDCIRGLRKVLGAISPEFRDEIFYYLVISYYFVRNYGQTLAFFQKLENSADQQRLNTIIQKVKSERQRLIELISKNFSRKAFKQLVDLFEGDGFLADDILTMTMKANMPGDPILGEIIKTASRYPGSCNLEFYLNASDYYKKIKKMKAAIEILINSRYYNSREEDYIELYYRVGEFYYLLREWTKTRVEMAKVKAIKDGYKESDWYIEAIEKLKPEGG